MGKTIYELIETLWNVNMPQRPQRLKVTWELIETLWNVNIVVVSTSKSLES